jgi:cell division protein FtsL
VVEQRRSRRRLRMAGMSFVGLIFGSMMGLAAFHSVLVQGQLHLDRLDTSIVQEQERQTQLRLQVAQLDSPARIVVAAQGQGMVPPEDRKFLASVVPGNVVPPPVTAKSTSKAKSTTSSATTGSATATGATGSSAK